MPFIEWPDTSRCHYNCDYLTAAHHRTYSGLKRVLEIYIVVHLYSGKEFYAKFWIPRIVIF
jgi:hypothetical protein